ncbi:hypothetical protein HY972_00875 [Candidatus Kaiserbacteria bacterium]|nr:hypothetical protein [Candidatus Kaiserbacteria bacterium]
MDTKTTTQSSAPDKGLSSAGGQEPEKYIRTFAGDMEILQKGGVPDLAPLEPAHPAPSERLVAGSPLPPTPAPTAAPIQKPVPAKATPPLVSPLETYSGDFSERVKETRASTATVLAAEQDAGREAPLQKKKFPWGNALYIGAGAVLLIAGGIGAYSAYRSYVTITVPVTPEAGAMAPIFVDEREPLSGTGAELLAAIEESVARPLAPSAVRLLYVASTSAESVFSALPLSAPDVLVRNINADGSMAGVANAGGSASPFFILSVSSYSGTFGGLLAWEARMPRDLGALFPAYPAAASASAATSSPHATTTMAPQAVFRDEVVDNHDVRVYRDTAGRSIVLYGYWNQKTLVIARDPAVFSEILNRLATSRTR